MKLIKSAKREGPSQPGVPQQATRMDEGNVDADVDSGYDRGPDRKKSCESLKGRNERSSIQ